MMFTVYMLYQMSMSQQQGTEGSSVTSQVQGPRFSPELELMFVRNLTRSPHDQVGFL